MNPLDGDGDIRRLYCYCKEKLMERIQVTGDRDTGESTSAFTCIGRSAIYPQTDSSDASGHSPGLLLVSLAWVPTSLWFLGSSLNQFVPQQ